MNKVFKIIGIVKFDTHTGRPVEEPNGLIRLWKSKKEAREDFSYKHNYPLKEVGMVVDNI